MKKKNVMMIAMMFSVFTTATALTAGAQEIQAGTEETRAAQEMQSRSEKQRKREQMSSCKGTHKKSQLTKIHIWQRRYEYSP